MLKSSWKRLLDWRRDDSGVSAIEFAFVVPIMITMYIGAVELSHALTVDRRVTAVASAAADLVAQSKEVSDADLTDIFEAATTIMTPYSATPISIVLSSVVADENNLTTVAWSSAHNGSARAEGSTLAVPAGLTQPFSSVIVAEVSYAYDPPVGEYLTGGVTLADTFYLRPRLSLTVEKTD